MVLKTGTITRKIFIAAKPEEVYEAYVNAKKHATFTGKRATIKAKIGGRFTAHDGYVSGKNLKLEKGVRIVQEWRTTAWPVGYPPSILELSFKKKGRGTELSMIHKKVPKEQISRYRRGWVTAYWKPLKEYFKKRRTRGKT